MIRLFVGGAGSGKTYQLMATADEIAGSMQLTKEQSLLGLTFMHGARRRLDEKLSGLRQSGHAAAAETLDSFCLRLVRMYRRKLGFAGAVSPAPDASYSGWASSGSGAVANFDTIRGAAAILAAEPYIASGIAASYPVLILDEVQDCTGTLLEATRAIVEAIPTVLAAGDEFQLLQVGPGCPALEWLEAVASIVRLDHNRRTETTSLLSSAARLRTAAVTGPTISVTAQPPGLAAWEIASRVAWAGWRNVAILSPAGPSASPYVRSVLQSLDGQLGKKKRIGPFPTPWEESQDGRIEELVAAAWSPFSDGSCTVSALELAAAGSSEAREVYLHLRRRARLLGKTEISHEDFRQAAVRFYASRSVRERSGTRQRLAMSIHSAKNREFDYVAVLWPYQVSGTDEYRRRLLYNAITRARKDAIVLVQGAPSRIVQDSALRLLA